MRSGLPTEANPVCVPGANPVDARDVYKALCDGPRPAHARFEVRSACSVSLSQLAALGNAHG